jgi:DnaJ-class molecular chaperone
MKTTFVAIQKCPDCNGRGWIEGLPMWSGRCQGRCSGMGYISRHLTDDEALDVLAGMVSTMPYTPHFTRMGEEVKILGTPCTHGSYPRKDTP